MNDLWDSQFVPGEVVALWTEVLSENNLKMCQTSKVGGYVMLSHVY